MKMATDERDVKSNANLATNDLLWESVHGKKAPVFDHVTNSTGEECIVIDNDEIDYSPRGIKICCKWMQNNVIIFNFNDAYEIVGHKWVGDVKTARTKLFDKLIDTGDFYDIPLTFVGGPKISYSGVETVKWTAKCCAYVDECGVIVKTWLSGHDMLDTDGHVRVMIEAQNFPCIHKKGINYGKSSNHCKQSFAKNSTFDSQAQIIDSMTPAQLYSGNRHVCVQYCILMRLLSGIIML